MNEKTKGIDITSYTLGKKAGGVTPTGEIDITQNGVTNVSGYATANVQVPEPTGTINITQNGETNVKNYETANVNVPQPSGKINITQNGTDIDVSSYATADVNVSGGATPTTPTECGTALKDVLQNYYNYMEGVKANRETYTDNSVVLYTPNINCKHYFVRYRNNVYSVVWLNNWQVNCYNSSFLPSYMTANQVGTYAPQDEFALYPNAGIYIGNSAANLLAYTSNETFSTPEAVIQAIMNNQLTYTQVTSTTGFGYVEITYSNSHVFTETRPSTGTKWTYTNTKIISHNETIQAMS